MSSSKPALQSADTFTSTTAWQDSQPDCLVVCCSDHRFEAQTRELVRHLNFKHPHVLQVPSGAVLTLPLASAINFLSKAADRIIERVVVTKHVSDVILVGHHDCGAYKIERVSLISDLIKRYTGQSVHDMQREHLLQAARRLRLGVRGVRVRAFFADVVTENGQARVRFDELT